MVPRSTDEAALVSAAQAGDEDALASLVRRHIDAVYGHALRFFGETGAAEDATQEVFLKVFRSISTYNGQAAFSTWLFRVTHNVCLDMVRRGSHTPVPIDPVLIEAPSTEDFADTTTTRLAVESAMRALAPEDRDALDAVTLFDLSYGDAAQLLGVPAGTVKSRVFRARRALAAMLSPTPEER